MKNYYEVLGVDFDATQEEIKSAYREMMKKYHPDKHTDDAESYEQKAKDINEAYEVLGNEEKRRDYNIRYILHEEQKQRRKQRQHEREERRTSYDNEAFSEYRTNRNKSRRHAKQKVSDNSFFGSAKKAYKEVREDESKYPFTERHRNLNKKFYKKHARKVDSTGDVIVFRIGQGIVHISAEALYQLSKLTYINKDNVLKYLIRNRGLVAMILAGVAVANFMPWNTDTTVDGSKIEVAGSSVTEQIPDEDDKYSDSITLIRNYTVKEGDSLSLLSDMSLTKVDDIKRINHFTNDMLYLGDVIKLPYEVSNDDIQYYTKVVETNGMSIADLANMYETDEDTLSRLNEEAIGKVNGTKIIMKNQILVPNFITSNELTEIKESKVKTY